MPAKASLPGGLRYGPRCCQGDCIILAIISDKGIATIPSVWDNPSNCTIVHLKAPSGLLRIEYQLADRSCLCWPIVHPFGD
jgi:hypothetical protein